MARMACQRERGMRAWAVMLKQECWDEARLEVDHLCVQVAFELHRQLAEVVHADLPNNEHRK